MGWNDWYTFDEHPSDDLVRKAADIMIKSGLADHGVMLARMRPAGSRGT